MREQTPMTQTKTISEVKTSLSTLVIEVSQNETRVLIEKDGTPVAALVSAEDLRTLSHLDEKRAARRRVVDAMREPFRDVPPEEIERETAKAVAEVRAEMRAEREAATARR
jgi:prevent-host-death family protein